MAHVRGGGELGKEWYYEGKLLNKKNSINDFLDCTKWLFDKNITTPANLIACGTSAGALSVGRNIF